MGEMAFWKKILLSAVLMFVFSMWFGLRFQLGMNGFLWWAIICAICLTPLNLMWMSSRISKYSPTTEARIENIAKSDHDPGVAVTAAEEERYYEAAFLETESGNVIPGVWGKAFANADGDTSRTKALYIKARVIQLSTRSENSGKDAILCGISDVLSEDVTGNPLVSDSKSPELNQDHWQCEKCSEIHEYQFDECWRCGHVRGKS